MIAILQRILTNIVKKYRAHVHVMYFYLYSKDIYPINIRKKYYTLMWNGMEFIIKLINLLFFSTSLLFSCPFSLSISQLSWNIYPTCFLPESLDGKPISALNGTSLESCIAPSRFNFAGITENILFIKRM